ncbi:MAG TPA: hypothetical protein VLS90_18300 [Thermodesulfobacteriota bacterium]|nr:hypothetical protein [Thermodesulfobacteriota bacterium]
MNDLVDHAGLVFVVSFLTLLLSVLVGALLRRRRRNLDENLHENYTVILGAALTLLGLIVGFSFSMATNRYDQRKNYEEAEANAIGTEYLRADFLAAAEAEKVRGLLAKYVDERILFYTDRDKQERGRVNAVTAQIQNELWSVVRTAAASQPTPVNALVVSGMNDVLNSQGYTQAAWWYRIPRAAWVLMILIAACCNFMVGYGIRDLKTGFKLVPILPLIISIAIYFIADIDSPRGGEVRIVPVNLMSLSESIRAQANMVPRQTERK